ncbi:MAG: ImmA/IrrE family metallo-endopeptidase [Candidatus Binatia bacterium]
MRAKNSQIFFGEKLRLARTFRGLTLSQVGKELNDIYPQFIAFLESGRKKPSGLLLAALGELLGFEVQFFQEPLTEAFQDEECAFRKRASTPLWIRQRALAHGTLLGMLISYLDSAVSLPETNLPIIRAENAEDIERAAEHCRMQWGLGLDVPIAGMTRVLELAGVVVAKFRDLPQNLDAFSRPGTRSAVILNEKSVSRSEMDLAHECGHLVLHKGKPTGTPETEREADHFGGAFLLPRTGFAREFRASGACDSRGWLRWDVLLRLKQRWRTSVQAMVFRAHELRLIDSLQYQRAFKYISARWGRKHELGEFDAQNPELISLAFEQVRKDYNMLPADLAHALHWYPRTLQEIAAVPIPSPVTPQIQPSAQIIEFAPKTR